MIEAWEAAEVRAAEKPLLDAGEPLMERAAGALATIAARDIAQHRAIVGSDGQLRDGRVAGSRAVLLIGSGNNGGDALYAGTALRRRGVEVIAVCASEQVHQGGRGALLAAGGRVEDASRGEIAPAVLDVVVRGDVILDALIGIGAQGALRGQARVLVEALNARLNELPTQMPRPWVIAVDLPSGIGVDDGTLPGPVLRADRTVTFGAAKPGLLLPPAAEMAGHGAVIDIGLNPAGPPAVRRLQPLDVARLWRIPGPTDHKYTRGVVGVVAGTSTYPGAAILATTAAVRTGAGMVRYRGTDDVTRMVVAARPEVVPATGSRWVDKETAWVIGSGIPPLDEDNRDPQHSAADAAIRDANGELRLSKGYTPAVIDAGGLTLMNPHLPLPPTCVLTPHAGELAALLRRKGEDVTSSDIVAAPVRWALRAHELVGATVLLKGAVTVIVGQGESPDAPPTVFAQADGPGWLATAGSGDVLAGILGTILAMHADRLTARGPVSKDGYLGDLVEPGLAAELAAAAVLIHGLAGHKASAGGPLAALDIASAVPGIVADLLAADPAREVFA